MAPPLLILAALAVVGVLAWQARVASGQAAVLSFSAPGSIPAGQTFQVQISVSGVTNLAAYEWVIQYDPNAIVCQDVDPDAAGCQNVTNGPFLGSTGRSVSCPPPIFPPEGRLQPGQERFGCATVGPTPDGPSGSGLLSTVNFQALASGAVSISFVCAALSDPAVNDIPISNVGPCVANVPTATPGPGETPLPTDTPVPGQPTATATTAPPSPTATPPGPTATPIPLPTPLPGEREQVQLVAGCNLRSFQPNYDPGTELIAVVVDISNGMGNPRLWFQVTGTTFFDLYDFRSTERSTKTVLGAADEAGFICLDGDAVWNRPVIG